MACIFVFLFHANIVEDELEILFNSFIINILYRFRKKRYFIELKEQEEKLARVHFIPVLEAGVSVNLRIPEVINFILQFHPVLQ
jgi:hypothetical protein